MPTWLQQQFPVVTSKDAENHFQLLNVSSLLFPPLLFSTSRDVSISRLPNRKAHASAKLNTEFD